MPCCNKRNMLSSRFFFFLVLASAALIFYLYNVFTPIYCDDYAYSFSFLDKSRITSVSQIIASLQAHYYVMNGRLVTHFLAHFYLMLDECVFDIVNTLVFCCLGLLIYYYSGFGWKQPHPMLLAGIFMLLYWITPFFGESYLWICSAVTYLHGLVIILLFFIPYWEQFLHPTKNIHSLFHSCTSAFLYLILGFGAGAVSETASLAMIVMILLLLAISVAGKWLKPWMITGCLGSLAGFVFMLSAPGNAIRMESNGIEVGILFLIRNFVGMSWSLLVYLYALLLLGLLLLAAFWLTNRKNRLRDNLLALIPVGVFLMGTAASYYSGIVSDGLPLRAYTGVTVLGLITCGLLLSRLPTPAAKPNKVIPLLCSVAVVITLISCSQTFLKLKDVRMQFDNREENILDQIADGQTDLEVAHISSDSRYSCFYEQEDANVDDDDIGSNRDVCSDPEHWINTGFARYWGVNSVRSIP